MTARILAGKVFAAKIREEVQEDIVQFNQKYGCKPGLAVIIVGENPASQVYVRNKHKACQELGIYSEVVSMPAESDKEAVLSMIDSLNLNERINGILVQLPLPAQISRYESEILNRIDPDKDVDGFHPTNMGKFWSGHPVMIPSTPAGIMEMFKEYQIELEGKTAVVIGRSNIVGKPMAQLLLDANATVTIAHSRTKNLPELARQADILVVAIGRGHFVTKEFVKPGAVVIDVGMNRDANGKLIGDVQYDEVAEVASYITPVPGGVGPMTITMLMEQTYEACVRSEKY